ncbi:MAG: PadR family transcriptional regulator [Candidatus Sumerlaeaceae bacterium]|nr:PadR family transcriptional regulator [Candidatus Sumerlaeaceae bacterium]
MRSWVAQMRKGLIELCVLGVLRDGEAYGYQLLQRLGEADGLSISESTVYPILARLAEDGMIKVRVAPSPTGPPRRYYRLTTLGQDRLKEMLTYWKDIRLAVEKFHKGEQA